jgi:hypothetical protein
VQPATQERVVGAHFFSPAHVMPLLEIVRTQYTSKQVCIERQEHMLCCSHAVACMTLINTRHGDVLIRAWQQCLLACFLFVLHSALLC